MVRLLSVLGSGSMGLMSSLPCEDSSDAGDRVEDFDGCMVIYCYMPTWRHTPLSSPNSKSGTISNARWKHTDQAFQYCIART